MDEASEAMADEPAESLERLEARICSGAADLTAAEAHWLLDVAEFDRREGWAHWGLPTCAAWLSWQIGLDPRAAREKVRVARALVEFPIFAAAMKTGVLTYSKARAITRIADHDTAEELLELAVAATSNQLERFVAAVRRADRDLHAEELEADDQRSLTSSAVGGVTEIVLRLPVEPGQAVLAAIEAFLPTDREASPAQRRADAIVALAEHAVARSGDEPTDEPRYLATLHLHPDDLDALRPTDADRDAGSGAVWPAVIDPLRRLMPCRQNRLGACCAMPPSKAWCTTVEVIRCGWAAPRGSCGAGSSVRFAIATVAAGSRAAPIGAGSTPTTSFTGSTAARPISRICCSCAGDTTGWCTN